MYTTSGDSEAAYLESHAEYDEDYLVEMGLVEDPEEGVLERLTDEIRLYRNRYDAAKVAKRGDTITCPVCCKKHSLSNKTWTSSYLNITWSDKTRMTWAMVSYDLREAITVCNCDLCGGIYGNV